MQVSKNKLQNTLLGLGLSEKEAQVYLASMALGPATISDIAQSSEIKRTTVYSVFGALSHKGLMREEIKGWKKLYVAENPERLDSMVESMKRDVRKNMPEFTAMYNLHSSGAFIKYYEGIESIKGVYGDLLKEVKAHDDYLIIGDSDQWLAQDPEFFTDFGRRRSRMNLNIRMLLQDSVGSRDYKKQEKMLNVMVKIMPPDFQLTTNLVIVPHKVVINQLTPPIMAMVIENQSIVQMNREMFEMIWRSLE